MTDRQIDRQTDKGGGWRKGGGGTEYVYAHVHTSTQFISQVSFRSTQAGVELLEVPPHYIKDGCGLLDKPHNAQTYIS